MTDLDYEILDAVSNFPAGTTQDKIQEKYFQGYDLTYNLLELSKLEGTEINGVRVSFSNFNVLETKEITIKNLGGVRSFYKVYLVTPRGKTMLENWKRRRAEQLTKERRQQFWQWVINVVTGVTTGVLATLICSEFLSL